MQTARILALHCIILAALCGPARAERLPLKVYTTADGLASSVILDVFPDSRGFLWFATRNGLSRFDGSEFRPYTTDDGLPNPVVNSVLETSDGEYWIATNGRRHVQVQPRTDSDQARWPADRQRHV